MEKNKNISWDSYFMSVALISSFRSKDIKTKNGACIVGENKKILGIGYNGLPKNFKDKKEFWNDECDNDLINSKHSYVIHAEVNSILNSNSNIQNSTIYITYLPCINCSKLIIQSGIIKVVFLEEKNSKKYEEINKVVKKILKIGKVKLIKFEKIKTSKFDLEFLSNLKKNFYK